MSKETNTKDVSEKQIIETISSERSKFIGYGTFMTDVVSTLKKTSTKSETWGIPIDVLGVVEVEDMRRICQPYSPFPYVVKEKGHSFWGVVFEIDNDKIDQLDRVEGTPYLYERHSVEIKGESYFIYLPSANTYQNHVRNYHRADLSDFWHYRVIASMNSVAKDKFRELLAHQVRGIDY